MFVFSHIISVDETDAKKILTASSWRTGGYHQDALLLHEDYPAGPEIQ